MIVSVHEGYLKSYSCVEMKDYHQIELYYVKPYYYVQTKDYYQIGIVIWNL